MKTYLKAFYFMEEQHRLDDKSLPFNKVENLTHNDV